MRIRLEDVYYAYAPDQPALCGISLLIEAGEQVALVGANGSGKSTLARCLNGLVRPQRGRVWVGELEVRREPVFTLAQRVAYVFQNPDDQLGQRTVADEVAFGPRQLGWPAERRAATVTQALEWLGLRDLARVHPHDLGLSERKLVALASALAMDAPVLILDEPTAGLDGYQIRRLEATLTELRRRGTTVILITHDLDFAAENLDRLVRLAAGQIVEDAPLTEIAAGDDASAPQIARLARRLGLPGPALTPAVFVRQLENLSGPPPKSDGCKNCS